MVVTREQFEAGMTYDAFKAQMTQNREQTERNEETLDLSAEDLSAFRDLPEPLNVLAIAEDWCPDVVANLPVLGRVVRESSGRMTMRVLLRDTEPGSTVMNQYLKDGQFRSIPTFVFLDQDFNEVGVFKERPAAVTARTAEKRKEIQAAHPALGAPGTPIVAANLPDDLRAQYLQAMADLREEMRPFANAEVVRELRAIVDRAAALSR